MKYYIYNSESKVDMLLPQIQKDFLTNLAAEIKIDLKFLSGTLKTEFCNSENRTKRLEVVSSYILKKKNVCEVDNADMWIFDTLPMTAFHLSENPEIIFFIGETEGTILLLGGSAKHLIGGEEKEELKTGLSFTPRLVKALNDSIQDLNFVNPTILKNSIADGDPNRPWKTVVKLLLQKERFEPKQNHEFLSFILLDDKIEEKRFVLATPLYVAYPV